METRRRSLAKALSWRFFATLITMCVVYALTRELTFAIEIGLLDTLAKIAIYFGHERIWQRIPYGKVEAPDYEI